MAKEKNTQKKQPDSSKKKTNIDSVANHKGDILSRVYIKFPELIKRIEKKEK